MHLIYRERHSLEERDIPQSLGHSPADLVVMSFSDGELGAIAKGWERAAGTAPPLPSLRLVNVARLGHPASVDDYIETTLQHAKAILVRLIGGESYWSYGVEQLYLLARSKNIALAILPGDGRWDAFLAERSNLPQSALKRLLALAQEGGPIAGQAMLAQLCISAGIYAAPVIGVKTLGPAGLYREAGPPKGRKVAVIFYRSHLVAADCQPIDVCVDQLAAHGLSVRAYYVASLKDEASVGFLQNAWALQQPEIIINATAFSAKTSGGHDAFSGLDAPVLQVALAGNDQALWQAGQRGLSPSDLAMYVALPEVDGRIFTTIIGFKAPLESDSRLEFTRIGNQAHESGIDLLVGRVIALLDLRAKENPKLAIVLSNYPGRPHLQAHAIGLDVLASLTALGQRLGVDIGDALRRLRQTDLKLALNDYRADAAVTDAWGPVANDAFAYQGFWADGHLVAIQPDRSCRDRDSSYHDQSQIPCHAYVAFYQMVAASGVDALVHLGAHGTLEWLPGKAVGLSNDCWPQHLVGHLPVIYPFIVNDPGEASQAKRRLGAITIGHCPPPLAQSHLPENLVRVERLLDEYSNADGFAPERREALVEAILAQAHQQGLLAELSLDGTDKGECLQRIDRFVCDIKESQFSDGLHVFGDADGEWQGFDRAIKGQFVEAGPSGSPYLGRTDVLPTGRNMFGIDPRAVPSPQAFAKGQQMAGEYLRRHLQDHGAWPRSMVLDLWGSASMRSNGAEFSMALCLAGLKPVWDNGSGRVGGFEVVPMAELDRPRVDVTLRLSGLFRDVFSNLAQLFLQATQALAERREDLEDNPYQEPAQRVFCPQPDHYGAGFDWFGDYSDAERKRLAAVWLSAQGWTMDVDGQIAPNEEALKQRLSQADSVVHVHDLPETDVLNAFDFAAQEGGLSAAMQILGKDVAQYQLDNTGQSPRSRTLTEDIARVVRARLANPDWIKGMMRHGFRGAGEIAASTEHLAAFAALTRTIPGHLFDLTFDATLANEDVHQFLAEANPDALQALTRCYQKLLQEGLWNSRRNSVLAILEAQP